MPAPLLFSIVDTPTHPNLSGLYARLGFEEVRLLSQRKAIAELRRRAPEWVVAEFVYAFNTYYQATNISNLDVFLHSLVKYAPQARVVVIADPADLERVERLSDIHPLAAVLSRPVDAAVMERVLAL